MSASDLRHHLTYEVDRATERFELFHRCPPEWLDAEVGDAGSAVGADALADHRVRPEQARAHGELVGHRWKWAIVRGVMLGAVLILMTLPDDPSPRPQSTALLLGVVWLLTRRNKAVCTSA